VYYDFNGEGAHYNADEDQDGGDHMFDDEE
jgi:hypothetical protein